MFQADLAFAVELIAIALGFYFLHLSKKENSKEIKIGAYILIVGGILTALCTGFYSIKYWMAGSYSDAPISRMHQSDSTMKGN
jgi:multisubunit Na+/H+ antiporter MnhB subunit